MDVAAPTQPTGRGFVGRCRGEARQGWRVPRRPRRTTAAGLQSRPRSFASRADRAQQDGIATGNFQGNVVPCQGQQPAPPSRKDATERGRGFHPSEAALDEPHRRPPKDRPSRGVTSVFFLSPLVAGPDLRRSTSFRDPAFRAARPSEGLGWEPPNRQIPPTGRNRSTLLQRRYQIRLF